MLPPRTFLNFNSLESPFLAHCVTQTEYSTVPFDLPGRSVANWFVISSKPISALQWTCSKASPVNIVCDMMLCKYVSVDRY